MLNDVLKIILKDIPDIAKILNEEKAEEITAYQKSIYICKKNLTEYFKYLILEDRIKEMSGETFVDICLQSDISFLINHRELREFAMENYEKNKKIREEIMHDDFENDEEKEKYENLEKRKPKPRLRLAE